MNEMEKNSSLFSSSSTTITATRTHIFLAGMASFSNFSDKPYNNTRSRRRKKKYQERKKELKNNFIERE